MNFYKPRPDINIDYSGYLDYAHQHIVDRTPEDLVDKERAVRSIEKFIGTYYNMERLENVASANFDLDRGIYLHRPYILNVRVDVRSKNHNWSRTKKTTLLPHNFYYESQIMIFDNNSKEMDFGSHRLDLEDLKELVEEDYKEVSKFGRVGLNDNLLFYFMFSSI